MLQRVVLAVLVSGLGCSDERSLGDRQGGGGGEQDGGAGDVGAEDPPVVDAVSCVQSNQGGIFACSDYPDADEAAAQSHCDTLVGSGEINFATFAEGPCPTDARLARCTYQYMGLTVVWWFYGADAPFTDRWRSSCGGMDGLYEEI